MHLVRPKKSVSLKDGYYICYADFSEESIERLKDSLTFSNPAYLAAKKYSRYGRVAIDPMLQYYEGMKRFLRVPIGTDLSCLGKVSVVDNRTVVYSPNVPRFSLTLREDQQQAASRYLSLNEGSSLIGAVQLPTGKGKTILALYLASQLRQKTLVIVHKDDLVTGWMKDISLCFESQCKPGLIKAKSRVVGDFITVATIQTLSRLDVKEQERLFNSFGLVILDEMHHCPASMFELVDKFTSKYRLGLTATPERKDGLSHVMQLYFGGFCYRYKNSSKRDSDILPVLVIPRVASFLKVNPLCELINGRWVLKDPRVDPDTHNLRKNEAFISDVPYDVRPRIPFGDYSDMIVRRIKDFVVSDIVFEYMEGHSCIVFLSQKQQVDDFADYLRSRFIPDEHILKYYGDNTSKQNDEVLKYAESHRQCITLATYSKATEGTNVKQWEVAFLVSSINDAKNTEQAVGRVRRVKEGKLSSARVYDYRCPNVYSISAHSRTRDARYRKLGFTIKGEIKPHKSLFSRGYYH